MFVIVDWDTKMENIPFIQTESPYGINDVVTIRFKVNNQK